MQGSLDKTTPTIAQPLLGALALVFLSVFLMSPVYAHHPFEGQTASFNFLQGLISGLAHPVLGVDHCLFLLSIGFAGFSSTRKTIILLLGTALFGSLLGLGLPQIPGTEILMALSLVVSAFVAMGRLSLGVMFPLLFAHGYVLSGVMVGVEPTPLLAYFIGLFSSEFLVVSVGMFFLRYLADRKNLIAGILIGVGFALTYGLIVV
ncbi:HupE/UreJ family protein [Prochlorococcus sp. MIT 1341]|uniref:HupE/UreJ family protein n=1 Tax=Prochlorococcus sp. MIT 1341 TaxID=3096221 RepID=UPI002A74A203|nr:HupE/UreJ family protein [Prochlorococcus sp. MIT 1341]